VAASHRRTSRDRKHTEGDLQHAHSANTISTMEQRFFESALELACDAREDGYEFPLVIVFCDQNHKLALVLTINHLGKLLPNWEWDTSGWIWAWEPNSNYAEPLRAALTSQNGRTRAGAVPLLSLSEAIELMDRDQMPN
jgi:hypothetical protein